MDNVEFISNLATVTKATDAAMQRAAEIIGGMMESKAKLYITDAVYATPAGWYVRTGNLRNSITHDAVSEDHGVTVIVGSNVSYAPFVELGTGKYAEGGGGRQTPWLYQDHNGKWHRTSGMPPRPYLRPAVENHIKDYRDVLQSELSKTP